MENLQEPLVLAQLFALIARFELSNIELAQLTGLAPQTIRFVRVGRAMPRHAHCRRALRAFIEKNSDARSKDELRATVSP